jgi:hypothetical protein
MRIHASGYLKNRWIRLCIGLTVLAAVFGFLSTEPRPPGMAGAIIDRNLEHDVQATALFYMDLDRMPEIQRRLESRVSKED